MTDEKLLSVIRMYEKSLTNMSVKPMEFQSDHHGPEIEESRRHLLQMIPKMREFINQGRREKAMCWLGFMQGVFWQSGQFSLDDLKHHSRPGRMYGFNMEDDRHV